MLCPNCKQLCRWVSTNTDYGWKCLFCKFSTLDRKEGDAVAETY